ncbi:carboxypeptidase-like regulatory domain-containing protein [Flagellimonas meridianipacifica]|uniref:Carboxypeptidase-like protein n=1 Tax=Flagellimonas meridianipacifica TaxID=1080225 RepID=A0A2T0MCE8_9FLAO|nr:carboxypeptidase-like regulatory domain-containing protein [Allomuricauda pacifica]PRX55163.1 carboxypeptidase-like protein [Allomuricauda pacifica]
MLRLKQVLLFCIAIPLTIAAQKDFKGRVLDAKTNAPIPYVNIGIVNKGVGTVSDEEGLFHLPLDANELQSDESILFSSLGYQPLEIPVKKVEFVYNEYPEIKLMPEAVRLEEVVVTNIETELVDELVGNKSSFGSNSYGYWKDNVALGGELASRIRVKKGYRKLNTLGFEIAANPMDSVLLRINIYDISGTKDGPKINLNKSGKNILFKLKKEDSQPRINLTDYSIFVEDDFIVSLELVKVYGNDPVALAIPAIHNETGSFRRYASQDKWEWISDSGMAYFLETSVFLPKKEAERIIKKENRRKKRMYRIYGFVINNGVMLSQVRVTNTRTKESADTDEKGTYSIYAKSTDILCFEKPNYTTRCFKMKNRATLNVQLSLDKK